MSPRISRAPRWCRTGMAVLVAVAGSAELARASEAATVLGAALRPDLRPTAGAPRLVTGFAVPGPGVEPLPLGSAFTAVESPFTTPFLAARRLGPKEKGSAHPPVFDAQRARVLLRSLTIPGWGQLTAGKRTSAGIFALAETGVWASFAAFRIQRQLRREASERTARLLAGIELRGRDEEFRRIVGAFISSQEYNQLVVFRDAANLYYDNPTLYRQYIAEHELRGADTWAWESEDSFLRYRSQRKNTHEAEMRANTALAVAVVNRLLSALHAARAAGGRRPDAPEGQSWNLEVTPSSADDATAFRIGVRTRF